MNGITNINIMQILFNKNQNQNVEVEYVYKYLGNFYTIVCRYLSCIYIYFLGLAVEFPLHFYL